MASSLMDDFYSSSAAPEVPAATAVLVTVTVETEWIDWRKHGRGYIRRMSDNTFVPANHVEWGKKAMKMYFSFQAVAGELLQVRLSDGSWKNDSKHYVRVRPDGTFESVSREDAGREIAATAAKTK